MCGVEPEAAQILIIVSRVSIMERQTHFYSGLTEAFKLILQWINGSF